MGQHEHEYNIAAEADVGGRINRQIWLYFIGLGIALALTFVGLTIFFRFQVDYEKAKKIGAVKTVESVEQMAFSESVLTGKRGLFEGKRNVAIDVAVDKFLTDAKKAH